jgi:hypothetical protein
VNIRTFPAVLQGRHEVQTATACASHKFGPAQKSWLFEVAPRSVGVMRKIIVPIIHGLLSGLRTRVDLQLEVMALRHQLEVLRNVQRTRARLARLGRAVGVLLYRLWARCLDRVVIGRPETDDPWHRDLTTDPRGLSLKHRATLSDPLSRYLLWWRVPVTVNGNGDHRGIERSALALAERLC